MSAVLESFADGILIMAADGSCLQQNERARQLCHRIAADTSSDEQVPVAIWSICECLLDSRTTFPQKNLILSQQLSCSEGGSIRIRVQWLPLHDPENPLLLVMMEDETQAARMSALLESRQFSLTDRETEVWMLRKMDYSYDEIAAKLFIATNTVKRHLKSIYAKRKQVLEMETL